MDARIESGMLLKMDDFVRGIPDKNVQVHYIWGREADSNENTY
jgi:hypothetical protein